MNFNDLVNNILTEKGHKPEWLEKTEVKAEMKKGIKVSGKEKKKLGLSKNPYIKKIGDRYKGLGAKSKKK